MPAKDLPATASRRKGAMRAAGQNLPAQGSSCCSPLRIAGSRQRSIAALAAKQGIFAYQAGSLEGLRLGVWSCRAEQATKGKIEKHNAKRQFYQNIPFVSDAISHHLKETSRPSFPAHWTLLRRRRVTPTQLPLTFCTAKVWASSS